MASKAGYGCFTTLTGFREKVGWKVADDRIQQMHDIVALYGADAIHSRGMYGETILHQVGSCHTTHKATVRV